MNLPPLLFLFAIQFLNTSAAQLPRPLIPQSCPQAQNFNLSGTINVPYPQLPGVDSNPLGSYDFSAYVYANPDFGKKDHPSVETFSVTNSTGEPVQWAKFPYQGCAIMVSFDENASPINDPDSHYINDPFAATCRDYLPQHCMESFVDLMNETAVELAKNQTVSDVEACSRFPTYHVCNATGGYYYMSPSATGTTPTWPSILHLS